MRWAFLFRAIGECLSKYPNSRKNSSALKEILVTRLGNKVCAKWDKKCIRNWENMLKTFWEHFLFAKNWAKK